jgi:aromatic-amino-acid transaminase
VFQNVDAYAGDPILSLMETFHQDPADKVNLSIGLYYERAGHHSLPKAGQEAGDPPAEPAAKASLYLPMEGFALIAAPFRRCCLATTIRR